MNAIFDQIAAYALYLGIPLLFLGIVLWVYRPGAARRYRADARIPFLHRRRRHRHEHHGTA